MNGIRHSARSAVLPVLILSGLALVQVPVQNQERAADPDRKTVERTDRTVDRSVLRLRQFRTAGDLENAGRLFALLFPSEQGVDIDAAAKTADEPLSNRLDNTPGDAQEVPPGTVVIGDGPPWTQPTLRRISDDAIGISFVKHRDGEDGDIYFARLSKDLVSDAEFPVAYSRAQQDNPAVASDYPAFSAPYVYVVYSEHEGAFHSIRFRVSRDLGASWSRAVTVASFSGPAGSVGETALAYDLDRGALYLAYTCPQGPSTGIAVSSSLSFGARWSTPVFVTAPDNWSETNPRIAATGGTVLVAYEHSAGAPGRDIGLAYSTSGGRLWTTGGPFASSAVDESAPDLRASKDPGPPRFFVSYVKDDAQVIAVSCEASNPETWSAEQVVHDGISVVDGGPIAVLPMVDSQGEVSAGVAWSGPTPGYDVYFGSAWLQSVQLAEPRLAVDP